MKSKSVSLSGVDTSSTIPEACEDMSCFTSFIYKFWLKLTQDGLLRESSPTGWIDEDSYITANARMTASQ